MSSSPSDTQPTTPTPDWEKLEEKPEFRALLARKAKFIISSTIFFVVYYFALLILVGWFPDFMKKEVLGRLNVAYLFALSQFFMAWIMAFVYVRAASGWDKSAASVISDQH